MSAQPIQYVVPVSTPVKVHRREARHGGVVRGHTMRATLEFVPDALLWDPYSVERGDVPAESYAGVSARSGCYGFQYNGYVIEVARRDVRVRLLDLGMDVRA